MRPRTNTMLKIHPYRVYLKESSVEQLELTIIMVYLKYKPGFLQFGGSFLWYFFLWLFKLAARLQMCDRVLWSASVSPQSFSEVTWAWRGASPAVTPGTSLFSSHSYCSQPAFQHKTSYLEQRCLSPGLLLAPFFPALHLLKDFLPHSVAAPVVPALFFQTEVTSSNVGFRGRFPRLGGA